MKGAPLRQILCAACLAGLVVLHTGCHSTGHHQSLSCEALPAGLETCDSLACDSLGCGDLGCGDLACDDFGCDAMPGLLSRQLVRGRPNRLLDDTGSFLGVVNKIALWDSRADNHCVSPQTEREVLMYLRRNGLRSTLVRSNQYDPLGEWQRLVDNKRMAAPWKYTFGTYDWLKYTFIPGRLIGGDHYNPFTDTVHLYSDIPSLGLAKAAYAKDVHNRTYQGTYAASQDTPIIGLWHETLANKEAIRYLGQHGTRAQVSEAERILYPDFTGAVGSQVLGFLPYGSVYGRAAGALGGQMYRGITTGDFMGQTATTKAASTYR